jgi:hypothetical protein
MGKKPLNVAAPESSMTQQPSNLERVLVASEHGRRKSEHGLTLSS